MPIAQNELEQLILKSFPSAQVTITDLVGDSNHYSVKIIAREFAGKSRIEQHKMVHKALDGYIGDILHAISLQTFAE